MSPTLGGRRRDRSAGAFVHGHGHSAALETAIALETMTSTQEATNASEWDAQVRVKGMRLNTPQYAPLRM